MTLDRTIRPSFTKKRWHGYIGKLNIVIPPGWNHKESVSLNAPKWQFSSQVPEHFWCLARHYGGKMSIHNKLHTCSAHTHVCEHKLGGEGEPRGKRKAARIIARTHSTFMSEQQACFLPDT